MTTDELHGNMFSWDELAEAYISHTKQIAELEAALKDALLASDVIDGKVCGCGFIGPEDYAEYKEAQERIEKARAVADGKRG